MLASSLRTVRRVPSILCLLGASVMAGCASNRADATERTAPLKLESSVVGTSLDGTPIQLQVLGDGPETIMILASIHGTEPAGTPLCAELVRHLQLDPTPLTGRRLVLMPIANPDGYARGERHNSNGVDLNRNFPAKNRGTREQFGPEGLSEPESRAIFDVLESFGPTRIVSIHQPLACVDWDGPALEIAKVMAAHCDLPLRRLGSRPGSLGSYAGVDLQIPIVTFELRKHDEQFSPQELWDKYGAALLAFIRYDDRS